MSTYHVRERGSCFTLSKTQLMFKTCQKSPRFHVHLSPPLSQLALNSSTLFTDSTWLLFSLKGKAEFSEVAECDMNKQILCTFYVTEICGQW